MSAAPQTPIHVQEFEGKLRRYIHREANRAGLNPLQLVYVLARVIRWLPVMKEVSGRG